MSAVDAPPPARSGGSPGGSGSWRRHRPWLIRQALLWVAVAVPAAGRGRAFNDRVARFWHEMDDRG